MKQAIQRGYIVPRWLHYSAALPSEATTELPPTTFSNTTMYRWKLVGLSFVGNPTTASAPYDEADGGLGTRILLELGKTGCGDMNLVPAPLTAFCAPPGLIRQHMGAYNLAYDVHLPRPYRLPRDSGLEVTVRNNNGAANLPEITFLARGVDPKGYPVVLGGVVAEGLEPGNQVVMDSADLYNKGKTEVYLDRFSFKVVDDKGTTWAEGLIPVSYLVNPTTGENFMPGPTPIPVGNIAPMCRVYDASDEGPRVYTFPPNTYLYPRQRLGVKLTNLTDADQDIHVCLFGELEVQ